MKYVILVAGLALAACEQTAGGGAMSNTSAAEAQRISTMEQLQPLLDRRWVFDDGSYDVVRADGSFGGGEFAGTWEMRDGFWCRALTKGAQGSRVEDCQLLQGDGTTFTATRQKGQGSSYSFTLGPAA